jgi:hypothetical protein
MNITSHKTHTGEIITGKRLELAVLRVASEWLELGYAIRQEDAYASHVTEAKKDEILAQHVLSAKEFALGISFPSFTMWQRLNTELTGECVALLA